MLAFHIRERGALNLARRAGTLFQRFGLTAGKMVKALGIYLEVTQRHNCTPTFPITTVAMKRNPRVAQWLRDQGAELAVHGYVHADYGILGLQEQMRHIQRACDIFERYRIPFAGFRCPYYRWNDDTWQVAAELGFSYSSNRVAHWDSEEAWQFSPAQRATYEKALELYSSHPASSTVLLPYFFKGMVEIPVTIPDDEALVERLRIGSTQGKARIWCDILDGLYSRGEMFTLSLHPERIYHCRDALEAVLARAKAMTPSVWMASLEQIARWWHEKREFTLRAEEIESGRYAIEAKASPRATVLARGLTVNRAAKPWYGGYSLVEAADFEVESSVKPFVGVPPHTSQPLVDFLTGEGYIVERSSDGHAYGTYLDQVDDLCPDGFADAGKRKVIDVIEGESSPLVRLWRWPDGARSCLAVTGDIDSITLVDFFMRPFEV